MFKNEYNGRYGNGYQPLERPPTTEYLSSGQTNPKMMDSMSVAMFFSFMFCSFCIGIAVGGAFGS